MSSKIFADISGAKESIISLKSVQNGCAEIINISAFNVSTSYGTFQPQKGVAAQSKSKAVEAVSKIDANAYMALTSWHDAIGNIVSFMEKSIEDLEEADAKG